MPETQKFDEKNKLFFNIVFFAFWPRFGTVFGSKMGTKIALWVPKLQGTAHFEVSKKLCFAKTAPRRAQGAILESPGVDLGGSGNDFLIF